MTHPPYIPIVDDHREIRDALVKYLEKNVMRATSAADAFAMTTAEFRRLTVFLERPRLVLNGSVSR
jgi:DNA-binding response OmpR family regulator